MKKIFTILSLSFLLMMGIANGQTHLWGAAYMYGRVFQTDINGNNFQPVYSQFDSIGSTPCDGLVLAHNGKFYGITVQYGGFYGGGFFYSYDPVTGDVVDIHDFQSSTSDPYGWDQSCAPICASNGKLYGMTDMGGNMNYGVIYEVDPNTNIYSVIYNFHDSITGINPYGGLIQLSDGYLYGVSYAVEGNPGGIFRFNPIDSTYELLHNLDTTIGAGPLYGALMKASDGKLYGTTSYNGAYGLGTIYRYDVSTNIVTSMYDFDSLHGYNAVGNVIQATNGLFYGMSCSGGANNKGVIYSFDPVTSNYNVLLNFDSATGYSVNRILMQSSSGLLFGTARSGGIHNYGVFFSYNINTNTYTILHNFDNSFINGGEPDCNIIELADSLIYPCSADFLLYADTSIQHHYWIINYATGVQPLHYDWNWGDGSNDDTIPYPSHTYADSGVYTICLSITDSTGCQSIYCDSSYHIMRTSNYMVTVNVISNIMTATKNTDIKNEISIYPNPASSILAIHQSSPSPNQQITITNILGEEIYHQTNNSSQSSIDVSKWSRGVYILRIRNEKETIQRKIIVE